MNRYLLLPALSLLAFARTAHADPCRDHVAKLAENAKVATAVYWNGKSIDYVKGDKKSVATGVTLVYFHDPKKLKLAELGLPNTVTLDKKKIRAEEQGTCAQPLFTWSHAGAQPASGPQPPPAIGGTQTEGGTEASGALVNASATCADHTVCKVFQEYRAPKAIRYGENSASSVAAEAAQILGQIVVDRASEAAYALARDKTKEWLKCDETPKLPATCKVLESLRLQDLAMAPDQLRAALAMDVLGLIQMFKAKIPTTAGAGTVRATFASSSESSKADALPTHRCASETSGPKGLRCAVNNVIADQVVAVLARPASSITGHPSEALVRRLVSKGLDQLENHAETKLCKLKTPERILALVAVSFAACQVNTESSCQIMAVVEQFDAKCKPRLSDEQLGYAQSMAGHFWNAVTLEKGPRVPDDAKRLIAALEGSFEAACMYAADNADGPFVCELDTTKNGETPVGLSESVAMVRDVVLAAANRDGAALGRAMIAVLGRKLPAAENTDVPKAMRVLATVTAYAATYTGANASSEEAHDQRTSLLKSLTADMSNRTMRGGDTIASFGGSLRLVGGIRAGHSSTDASMMETRDMVVAAPLSLPLGFALDHLWKDDWRSGIHIELGLLDLGQYLSWEEGGKVATPDLTVALSPSATVGYFWGRQLPFFVGGTFGYTPGFDFDSDDAADKKGAYNIGLTAGFYVPLLDLN
jgi:hypothetical protein